jgi:hypothetical protein
VRLSFRVLVVIKRFVSLKDIDSWRRKNASFQTFSMSKCGSVSYGKKFKIFRIFFTELPCLLTFLTLLFCVLRFFGLKLRLE